MGSVAPSWQDKAAAKRQAVLDLIPVAWRLPQPLPAPKAQKDVTGAYVHQYLSPREVEVTEADAAQIVANTTAGTWTATEVVTAFCHRAAIAHQLVPQALPSAVAPLSGHNLLTLAVPDELPS